MNAIAQEKSRTGSVGWTFWLQWVAASLVGLAVGASFLLGVSQLIDGPPHKGIMGAVVGACVGTMQSLVFRRRVSGPAQWIAVSTVAWGIAAPMELIGGFFLSIAVVGAITGVTLVWMLRMEAANGPSTLPTSAPGAKWS